MKVYTEEMLAKSFAWSNKLDDKYVKFDGEKLYYSHPEAASFKVAFPQSVEQLPDFVRGLVSLGYEEKHFNGARIWFSEVGIWNEFIEGIGYQLLESINTAAGQPMAFEKGIGYNFRADEFVKMLGVLMQSFLFGWDAYYLPSWTWGACSEYFLQVSHDGFVIVTTKTKAYHEPIIRESAKGYDLIPNGDRISRYLSVSDLEAMKKSDKA